MWKKEEADRREQLFPPAEAWRGALTPPGLQKAAKPKTRDHLLVVQVILCILLLSGVLVLRRADPAAYQVFREEYRTLMEQQGIGSEELLRLVSGAAEGVLQQVSGIAEEWADEGADAALPTPGEDPLWDSTSLAALFGGSAPAGSSLREFPGDVTLISPLQGNLQVTSSYGWRRDPLTWKRDFHTGVDLAAREGDPVLAAAGGIVAETRRSESYGNCVRVLHTDGAATFYCHMQYIFVHQGEQIEAGARLGTAGQTGRVTGPHLHFELLRDDLRYDPAQALGL